MKNRATSYPSHIQLTMIVLAILMTIMTTYPMIVERSLHEELGGFGFCVFGYISLTTYMQQKSADGFGMAVFRLMCIKNCRHSQSPWMVRLITLLQWVWTILAEVMITKGILTSRDAVVFNICYNRSPVFMKIMQEYEGTITEEARKEGKIWQGLVLLSMLGKNNAFLELCIEKASIGYKVSCRRNVCFSLT